MASKKEAPKQPKYEKKRQLRRASRKRKRDRSQRKPRRNDWMDYADADATDLNTFERIMPLDESDRRRDVEAAAQSTSADDDISPADDTPPGRVIEVSSDLSRVQTGDKILMCSLRGKLTGQTDGYTHPLTVGDYVQVTATDDERGTIDDILPRQNLIARPAPGQPHLQQPIVANLDQLLIVAAWRNPNIWYELIDRYIIAAERNGIQPVICVNKADLADDPDTLHAELAPYRQLGYTVIVTSAETGTGIDTLRAQLENKVSAVVGLSGVGKSSLLSAVQPDFALKVGETNEDRGQGRHTTTQAQMLPFGGGYVVDTPGIREFGLSGLTPLELTAHYPEIQAASRSCRFSDCTHTHEPKCGVQAALQEGEISQTRCHSYTTILSSL